jgi:2-polyprenyl-6-methoxyphenol hydroxylase-like FAD-dependent oxidoreductase
VRGRFSQPNAVPGNPSLTRRLVPPGNRRPSALAERFRHAIPISWVLGCGPGPHCVRQPVGPGWALAGDASIHQDPWTGVAIDLASTHAIFLSRALLEMLEGQRPEADALAGYWACRNEHALATYRQTTEFAKDLSVLAGEWAGNAHRREGSPVGRGGCGTQIVRF